MDSKLESKIEILSINDRKEEPFEPQEIVPHERQVIEDIIKLWKEDPETESFGVPKLHKLIKKRNPKWSLSEKRLKVLLKQYGLLTNNEQFTYHSQIKSDLTPDLTPPPLVKFQMTKSRGKGLYSTKVIEPNTVLWEEEPLFFIPPLSNTNLVKVGKACTYCSNSINTQLNKFKILNGLDCNICNEIWCSSNCKQKDILHNHLKHSKPFKNLKFDNDSFDKLTDYCLVEQWNALHAIMYIHAYTILDKSGKKLNQFNSMARISQDIRYKALNSSAGSFDTNSGGAVFIQEQQENLWKEGFKLFNNVFPTNPLTYAEFMNYLGTFNINNVDGSVYALQSHLNHNCDPTVEVDFKSNKSEGLKIKSMRQIKANEELTISYVNPNHLLNQRRRELRVNWGFICTCNKCKEDTKTQHRRKSSAGSMQSAKEIRDMLKNSGEKELSLPIPELDQDRQRRKSVRFDEKVIAVNE